MSHDLTRFNYRTIQTKYIKQAEAFRDYLSGLLKHHKIKERMDAVALQMEQEATPELQLLWHRLDQEKGRYVTAAVKKFRRGMHRDPWSLPLARSGLIVRYWSECIKAVVHGYDLPYQFVIKQVELGLPEIGLQSEADLRLKHKLALITYKQCKRDAIPLRDQYLVDLAEAYTQGDEAKKAQKIRTLRQTE